MVFSRPLLVTVALLFLPPTGRQSADHFLVNGPTIIGFCPITQREVDLNRNGEEEALSDFQFYLSSAMDHYKGSPVRVFQTYTRHFFVKNGAEERDIAPKQCGVLFESPGRAAHVEYGVATDEDIYEVARKYFGNSNGRIR